MSKRMSQPATAAAAMVTILPHRLEAGCAAPFLHIRSAILKISQPRAVKPTPQKSMTDTIAFPFCFLQDTYALSRSAASNKLLKSNRRGQGVLRHRDERLAFLDRIERGAERTSLRPTRGWRAS
jgi:hypothetical protein